MKDIPDETKEQLADSGIRGRLNGWDKPSQLPYYGNKYVTC